MRKALPLCLFLIFQTLVYSQVVSFEIEYDGIQSDMPSPHIAGVNGNIGIKNPERGYSIRGGIFDLYSNSDYPTSSYYTDLYGNTDLGIEPLETYINTFVNDGISLVEIETYIHYKDSIDNAIVDIHNNHINEASSDIPELLNDLGIKTHFILNSSFRYYQNGSDGVSNILSQHDGRYNKTLDYFDAATPVFEAINPYVAVAHLGWISSPWDFNQYRLSSHWKQSNYNIASNYPIGSINYDSNLLNFHGTDRESVQRSAWGGPHNQGSVWNFQSALNHLKTDVLNKTLDVFSDKKVLLKSTNAIAQYIGTSLNISTPVYEATYPINYVDQVMLANYCNDTIPMEVSKLQDDDRFLRVGYYENAFGGNTYSHYWTIGNAFTQHIQWSSDFSSSLGTDWANNPFYTDVHNLRKYRGNLWMHGEMPVYETEDTIINKTQNLDAWFTSSFNRNHQYYSNWYEGVDGIPNYQYDYENGEGISSGRLQDGFYSALKLKYFNFTSFNISHNYLLDGRSPYEMVDGFDNSTNDGEALIGAGIPQAENTSITGWRTKMITESQLNQFGMPVSNQYFNDASGNPISRSAYDYIRDHLGYRLELQSTQFNQSDEEIQFSTRIINRGFAAPQNKRKLYLVLMNEYNELIRYTLTDIDWRTWQPDQFSEGNNNANNLQFPLQNSSYNSMDELIIGGIPLGEHNSNWHHSSITTYNPFVYNISHAFNISDLVQGQYKIGILLPDNHESLKGDGRFAVRFANQAQFIPCTGVTVLGHFTKGPSTERDDDGDGIVNINDINPLKPNPNDYFQDQLLSTDPCSEFMQVLHLSELENIHTISFNISPIPAQNMLNINSHIEWENGQILSFNGQILMDFKIESNDIDISKLNSGIYLLKLSRENQFKVQRFVIEK